VEKHGSRDREFALKLATKLAAERYILLDEKDDKAAVIVDDKTLWLPAVRML